MSVIPVAPIQAAIGSRNAPVDARRVARIAERADDGVPLVGDAVAIGVLETPDARGRSDVQRAVVPRASHRKRHLVREHDALVETPVAVGILEHAHGVRQ